MNTTTILAERFSHSDLFIGCPSLIFHSASSR
jgi:hypothetical protein